MKSNLNPKTDRGEIDAILGDEEELIPSSGFLAATMERVRDEAACPEPIPFPWLRALPGIVLVLAVFGWCGFEVMRAGFSAAPAGSTAQMHWLSMANPQLQDFGWVAMALGIATASWLFARRLAGRSGLL